MPPKPCSAVYLGESVTPKSNLSWKLFTGLQGGGTLLMQLRDIVLTGSIQWWLESLFIFSLGTSAQYGHCSYRRSSDPYGYLATETLNYAS